MSDTKAKLKQVLVKSLRLDIEPSTIPDTQVADRLGIDSIKALEFLVWVENEFSIEIDDSALSAQLVDSLDTLAAYIDGKRGTGTQAGAQA